MHVCVNTCLCVCVHAHVVMLMCICMYMSMCAHICVLLAELSSPPVRHTKVALCGAERRGMDPFLQLLGKELGFFQVEMRM